MSSKAWGVIGAVVCVGGFQLLKYTVGTAAGCAFAAAIVVAAIAVYFVYQRRLAKLRDQFNSLSEADQNRFLEQIDPGIADDLRQKVAQKDDSDDSAKPTRNLPS